MTALAALRFGGSSGASRWPLAAMAVAAVATACRAPILVTSPRFWAEEGTVYFSAAYHASPASALASAHLGYYALYPNVSTLVAARLVRLEHAPLVTVLAAMLVQLLPFALILFRLRDTLRPMEQLLLCAVVAAVVHTGEIWLTTVAAQYHLAVASFCVLLADPGRVSRAWRALDRLVIALSALTGVISCLLLPAFAVRWIRGRSRHAATLAVILGAGTALQLAAVVLTRQELAARLSFPGVRAVLASYATQFLLWPFMGPQPERLVASAPARGVLAALVLLAAAAVALRSRRSLSVLAFVSFLCVSGASVLGSLGMGGGWRYAYAPAVVLVGLFVVGAGSGRSWTPLRWLAAALVAASLAAWVPAYRAGLSPWIADDAPQWRQEVALWRDSPDRALRIWPWWEDLQVSVRLRPP